MKHKFVLLIQGETYRLGPQMTRTRGGEESYSLQMEATKSHLSFIRYMKEKFNFDCDIILNFYTLNEEYDNKLISKYSKYIINKNLNKDLIGEKNLFNQSVDLFSQKNINEYDFILFIRADHYLKEFFIKNFIPFENRILFAFPSLLTNSSNSENITNINEVGMFVDHQIIFVPQKHFDNLTEKKIYNQHSSYVYSVSNGISEDEIWFFVNTLHSSSTDISWNPLFHQIGRKEKTYEELYEKGYYVDLNTRKAVFNEYEIDRYLNDN
jgi:hypothetical protein